MTVLDDPHLDELDFEPAPRVFFSVDGTDTPDLPAPVTSSTLFPDTADVAPSILAGMRFLSPEAHLDWQQQVSAALENTLPTTVPLPEGPFPTRELNLSWSSPELLFPPSGFDVFSAVRDALAALDDEESVYFAAHCYFAMCSPSRGAYFERHR